MICEIGIITWMMLCLEPHYVELLKYEVINLIEIKIYAPADLNHRMEMQDRHSLYCFLSTPNHCVLHRIGEARKGWSYS